MTLISPVRNVLILESVFEGRESDWGNERHMTVCSLGTRAFTQDFLTAKMSQNMSLTLYLSFLVRESIQILFLNKVVYSPTRLKIVF